MNAQPNSSTFPDDLQSRITPRKNALILTQAMLDRGLTDEQFFWLLSHLNFTPLVTLHEIAQRPAAPNDEVAA